MSDLEFHPNPVPSARPRPSPGGREECGDPSCSTAATQELTFYTNSERVVVWRCGPHATAALRLDNPPWRVEPMAWVAK